MSRWHHSSCIDPDVAVHADTLIPHCRACRSSPDLDEIIRQQNADAPTWVPPSDESLSPDDLKLWWPPSVPWTGHRPKEHTECRAEENKEHHSESKKENHKVQDEQEHQTDDNSSADENARDIASHSIYDGTLKVDEFRLLCLSAAPTENSNYPLHGTLNVCSREFYPEYEAVSYTWTGDDGDTLRSKPLYLGPFWDVQLQNKNCGSMLEHFRLHTGSRFVWIDAICINQKDDAERSSQVAMMSTIYEDCHRVLLYLGPESVRPGAKPYRARRPLQSMDHEQLLELLQRRYFKRVWVIQELLLAPKIIIPIQDVDYQVNRRTPGLISHAHTSWDWNKTQAPWVQYMAQGANKMTFSEALAHTTSASSTDPRDKIFGILALVNPGSFAAGRKITPDYSLTPRQLEIGISAYLLLSMNNTMVLWNASRTPAGKGYPSWVPDFRRPLNWNGYDLFRRLSDAEVHTPHTALRSLQSLISVPIEIWNLVNSVNSSTGGLSLRLLHFLELNEKHNIELVSSDTKNIIVVKAGKFSLNIFTGTRFSKTFKQEGGHLFLYGNNSQSYALWFLLLQKISGSRSYRLASCIPCRGIKLMEVGRNDTKPVKDSWFNLGDLKCKIGQSSAEFAEFNFRLLPYANATVQDVYQLFKASDDNQEFGYTQLASVLTEIVKTHYNALDVKFADDVVFSFKSDNLEHVHKSIFTAVEFFSWRRIRQRSMHFRRVLNTIDGDSSLWAAQKNMTGSISFMCDLREVHEYLKYHNLRSLLLSFKLFCPGGSEEVARGIGRLSEPRDRVTFAFDCPEDARQALGIDGTMHDVEII